MYTDERSAGASSTLSKEEETVNDFRYFLSALRVFQKLTNTDMSSPSASIDGLGHEACTL